VKACTKRLRGNVMDAGAEAKSDPVDALSATEAMGSVSAEAACVKTCTKRLRGNVMV